MQKKTAVIFEVFEGNISNASWEALTCAEGFSSGEGETIIPILPDRAPEKPAAEIAKQSGRKVIALSTPETDYNSDITKKILNDLLRELQITHVCLAGTTRGLDYGPALAVRLQMTCITGVEKVSGDPSGLTVSRSIYGGKITEKCPISDTPAIIITQPGTFKPYSGNRPGTADVELRTEAARSDIVTNLAVERVQQENSALAEASVIVSAGRGLKEKENLILIEQLAAVFPKSAVGGSRPICDLEWLPYRQQVGITGATVTPDLYLACGISGAAQHISGMRNSGYIVSVNIDPRAAIFNYSDICIVEDLTTFIPVFLETVEQKRQA